MNSETDPLSAPGTSTRGSPNTARRTLAIAMARDILKGKFLDQQSSEILAREFLRALGLPE